MQSYNGTLDLHTFTRISLVCKAYKNVILSKSALEQGQRRFVTDMLKCRFIIIMIIIIIIIIKIIIIIMIIIIMQTG